MRVRRRRKNPSTTGLKRHASLKRRAASLGLSTKGTSATLSARLGSRKNPKRKKRRKAARSNPRKRRARRTARKNPAAPRRRKRRARRNPRETQAEFVARGAPGSIGTGYITAAKRSAAAKKGWAKRRRSGTAPKGKKRRGRRMSKASALKRARRARHVTGQFSRSARRILKAAPKRSARRGIARSYMSARSISRRVKKGYIKGANAQLARAYGLTKINFSLQGAAKDFGRIVLPVMLPGFGAFIGAAAAGHFLGHKLAAKISNPMLQKAAVPATGFAITGLAFTLLKMSKSAAMQRAAMPVAFGGSIATLLLWFLNTKTGQDLAAKVHLPVTLKEIAASSAASDKGTQDAVEVMAKSGASAGLNMQALVGGYMTVNKFMGAVAVHESPANWYGRSDMAGYVGAGAKNSLGEYASTNYQVHDATPGDNVRSMAKLLNGFGGMTLQDTPGGTEIHLGGIFDGESAIG